MNAGPLRDRPLGRGLTALLGEDRAAAAPAGEGASSKTVGIDLLRPNRLQPRRDFDEAQLDSRGESIRAQGLLQPILVRRDPDRADGYEIVAGERRWRAAQRARLHEVPVLVREVPDRAALEIAIVENVQRQDLNPVEEAQGYRRLIDDFGHRQDDVARLVGRSRSHVANMLRLLNLPEEVTSMLVDGRLSAGHARALLGAAEPGPLARAVAARGLNVRQTERLVRSPPPGGGTGDGAGDTGADTGGPAGETGIDRELSMSLGLRVSVRAHKRGGALTIHYATPDQLDDVVRRLVRPAAG